MARMKTASAVAILLLLPSAASAQSAKNGFELKTVSSRADLVSGGDVLVQVTVPATVGADKLAIDAGGRALLQAEEGPFQNLDADVVQERGQLLLPVPGNSATYAGLRL